MHIIGNYSAANGGGIGCNGSLYIGGTTEVKSENENPKDNVKGVQEDTTDEDVAAKVKGVSSNQTSAKTGDDARIKLFTLIMIIAAIAAGVMLYRRRTLAN